METIKQLVATFSKRGFIPEYNESRIEALARIKEIIPKRASVMCGSSKTLDEIGFTEYLNKDFHGWDNLHASIIMETDGDKRLSLRKQSSLSEYYLGSVHAITENGELIIASGTGSQLPHLAFTSSNVILVVGIQKIVRDLDAGLNRLNDYVLPLEDKRMKQAGFPGSSITKVLIMCQEPPVFKRKIHILLVNEKLGF